jgi:hypothetical protein
VIIYRLFKQLAERCDKAYRKYYRDNTIRVLCEKCDKKPCKISNCPVLKQMKQEGLVNEIRNSYRKGKE